MREEGNGKNNRRSFDCAQENKFSREVCGIPGLKIESWAPLVLLMIEEATARTAADPSTPLPCAQDDISPAKVGGIPP
jgi:hypothetical protein